MKIELDENLPGRLAPLFPSRGHDVDTVVDEDLAAAVEDLLDSVDVDDLAGCVAVYRDGDLPVRRPPGRA